MKKALKAFLFINFILLYGYISSTYNTNTVNASLNTSPYSNAFTEDCSPFWSSEVFSLKAHAENSVPTVHNVVFNSLKIPFKESYAGAYTSELLYENILSLYIFYSNVFLVKLLQSLIIFPFHSFW